ncbi:MAG: acetyl-CoA carboxylase biotin carboxyl carrier protein [FCB group bacterium]
MDLNYLKKILKIFDESSASEMLVEEEGIKLKLSKNRDTGKTQNTVYQMPGYMQPQIHQGAQTTETQHEISHEIHQKAQSTKEIEAAKQEFVHTVHSPIVGTFYRAPSPESPAFVEVGTHIDKGTVICIVEAMKLMNEIESDVSGTIEKILAENTQPVEYNQPLFIIRPD